MGDYLVSMARRIGVFIFASLLLVQGGWAGPVWMKSGDYDKVGVVLEAGAAPAEKTAASLFQKYWASTTGHKPAISKEGGEGVNVWIGLGALPEEVKADLDVSGLGSDGVLLHAFRSAAGKKGMAAFSGQSQLVIAGETPRGTLNGVFQFFEEYMGVRWLAPGMTHVPKHPPAALPAMDVRHVPPFEFRYVDFAYSPEDAEFDMSRRLSGKGVLGNGWHSVYDLVPPEKHFGEHPEYYALVNGKRIAPAGIDWRDGKVMRSHARMKGQLCFSNPAVAELMAAELKKRMKENPEAQIWTVSQMDWGGHCECPECAAIEEEEGRGMGPLLRCVNRVAQEVSDDFPDNRIATLASQWSRKPPKSMTPESNVIIAVCTSGCDFAWPVTHQKSELNRDFHEDLLEWTKIAPCVYVYDYALNTANYQMVYPDWGGIGPNFDFFAQQGVRGVFLEGACSPGGEFAHLRDYVFSRRLWNNEADTGVAVDDFIDLYYGKAGEYIKRYLSLMMEAVKDTGFPLKHDDTGRWLEFKVVSEAQAVFRNALDAVEGNEGLTKRVKEAEVPVHYAALTCPPRLKYSQYEVMLQRPASPTVEEYAEILKGMGVTHLAADLPFEGAATLEGIGGGERRKESRLAVLENEAYLVWVAPGLEGAVLRWRDKKSSTELLNGFRTFGRSAGTMQEWTHTPNVREHVVAPEYVVTDRTLYGLVLQAKLENGLTIERTMELRPSSEELEVEISVQNPTDKPIVPNVKIHPEFFSQGSRDPEIWVGDGYEWIQLNEEKKGEFIDWDYLEVKEYQQWALRLPERGLTIVNDFEYFQLESLFYYMDLTPGALHVNLELIPLNDPLGPGESRQIKCSYAVTKKKPQQL